MPQMPKGFKPLPAPMKALLDEAAAKQPADLVVAMRLALMFGDVETCTYITAKHFDKLPLEVQQELTRSGLKSISDITQDLVDGKYETPEATVAAQAQLMLQTDKATAIVH